ncbi:zinc-type alcohol dehydrogenase-like protein YcjQ [Escherichia coli]|nr:zinc-type alcohol dehydrogenase-like protein YcjQ [Escherichia coli]
MVIGVDPIAYRCDIARRHGADFCLNPIGTDVGKEIKTLTGKQGADVIIETSGYADALQSALRGLAYGGTISYVAFAKPFAEGFNLGREAHFNNAKIVFSPRVQRTEPGLSALEPQAYRRNLLGTADERLSQLRRFNRPGGDLCQ